jgi:type I restriction enzyme S subunit
MLADGWPETRLGDKFRISTEGCDPSASPQTVFLHHSLPAFDEEGGPIPEAGGAIQSNKHRIDHPCVLVSKLNPRIPRVSMVEAVSPDAPQCASTEFIVYAPLVEEVSLRFYMYYFGCAQFQRRLEQVATGTTNSHTRVTPSETLRWLIPAPPYNDQRAVASAVSAPDAAIQKTEAVIAKLKLMKTGLLHDLLTRGIDENGELRDPIRNPGLFRWTESRSIPKNWVSGPLGSFLASIDAGKSPDCPGEPAPAGQWGVLKVSSVNPEGFRPGENKRLSNDRLAREEYSVRHGDVLITRANTSDLVGAVCWVENPPARLLLCDKTLRLNFRSAEIEPKLMASVLQGPYVRRQIQMHATGTSAGMKNISQRDIRSFIVVFPEDPWEQRRIRTAISGVEQDIRAEETLLAKLKHLKHGLMHDLLTGRVRVPVQQAALHAAARQGQTHE